MTFFHVIGDWLRQLLEQVSLSTARWMFIGLFLVLLFWIVQLPASQATPNDRQSKWHEDLRIWAWIAVMFQIVIYSVF